LAAARSSTSTHGTQLWTGDGLTSFTKFEAPGGELCTPVPDGELCGNAEDDDEDGVTDEARSRSSS